MLCPLSKTTTPCRCVQPHNSLVGLAPVEATLPALHAVFPRKTHVFPTIGGCHRPPLPMFQIAVYSARQVVNGRYLLQTWIRRWLLNNSLRSLIFPFSVGFRLGLPPCLRLGLPLSLRLGLTLTLRLGLPSGLLRCITILCDIALCLLLLVLLLLRLSLSLGSFVVLNCSLDCSDALSHGFARRCSTGRSLRGRSASRGGALNRRCMRAG